VGVPTPGFGSQVKLSSGDACGLFNLGGIGKTLSCKCITPGRGATSLLKIEPACPSRNEDVVHAWMPFQQVRVSKL